MTYNCNETGDKKTDISSKNVSKGSSLCESRRNLFCPVCICSHSFKDRSRLRVHLEEVHHVYGRLLTELLDNSINSGSLNLEKFTKEYHKISKNYSINWQTANFPKEGIQ